MNTGGTGALVLQNSAVLQLRIFSGLGTGDNSGITTAADILRIGGNFTLSGSNTLTVLNASGTPDTAFSVGDTWRLIDWTTLVPGTITGSFTALNLPTLSAGFWDTSNLFVTSGALSGTIAISGVPEPSRMLLVAFGLAGLLLRRRRK